MNPHFAPKVSSFHLCPYRDVPQKYLFGFTCCCVIFDCRYLCSEIEQGLGREIRCPEHDCYKIVPNVSSVPHITWGGGGIGIKVLKHTFFCPLPSDLLAFLSECPSKTMTTLEW